MENIYTADNEHINTIGMPKCNIKRLNKSATL